MERIKFLYVEEGREIKEIRELLSQCLIKHLYTDNYHYFIYLTENEKNVFEKIKSYEHSIENIIDKLELLFDGENMTVKNLYNNEITVESDTIIEMIGDDLENYLPIKRQLAIYNSNEPIEELKKVLNEVGKMQLRIQIESFLYEEVDKANFE